jgi:hypothetical protein
MVFVIYYLSTIATRACLPPPLNNNATAVECSGWLESTADGFMVGFVARHELNTCASSLCKLMHLSQIIAIELFFFSLLPKNIKSL